MKKFLFAAAAFTFAAFTSNAQNASSSCTGCTAQSWDYCSTNVTVSLANVLEMDCDNCAELQACANTINEWRDGVQLGGVNFSVASTKNYNVYAGLGSSTMSKVGGGTGIGIGSGANQIQIFGKFAPGSGAGGYNLGGTVQGGFTPGALTQSNGQAIAVRSGNNYSSAAQGGSSAVVGAAASLTHKSAKINLRTGPLPLNTPNGDYKVDFVIAAIQQ